MKTQRPPHHPTIYLDHHATTPCDPRVVAAMLPYFTEQFGNPGSSTHRLGMAAEDAVRSARHMIAGLINAQPSEIVFTSSATESNNLALLGAARSHGPEDGCFITTAIEHLSVLAPLRELERRGYRVHVLPVDRCGHLDEDQLMALLQRETALLVSIQAASNEIGTIQRIAHLAPAIHDAGALFHVDAVQAVGRINVDVDEWGIDLMSFSAHKLYGPKGVAALYVRNGVRHSPLQPIMFGGGQEDGLRPGTLNVPGIVGFGEAARICANELPGESVRIEQLRNAFEAAILAEHPDITRNGDLRLRLPGNSSLTFTVEAEALIARLPQLALSTGSACHAGALDPSHVLSSIGLSRDQAYLTLRFGFGRFSTQAEVETAAKAINAEVAILKRLSNL